MARTLFISYRRSDSLHAARRIRDKLAIAFGAQVVFIDEGSLIAGDDFPEAIRAAVARCRVLLVIIGPGWVDASDDQPGRRLLREGDWVRQEVATGLGSRRTRVIPVLRDGAAMPTAAQLPPSLQDLVNRQFLEISEEDIDEDCLELVAAIEAAGVRRQKDVHRSRTRTAAAALVAGMVIAVLLLVVLALNIETDEATEGQASGQTSGQASGQAPPTRMGGSFNVAVADFESEDPKDQAEAGLLAVRLAKRLQEALPEALPEGTDVEVRGPEAVGAIEGTTREARQESASRIAQELGADVVIDGEVSFAGPSRVVPMAFLNPNRLADHPELGGYYRLDSISASGSATNSVTKENLIAGLSKTTEAMGSFISGVSYFGVLDADPSYPGIAETKFRTALESPNLPEDAEEGAHAFLGSLALLRGDLGQAEAEYRAAVGMNPDSVRGRLGLAEVLLRQSSGQLCAEDTVSLADLRASEQAFADVLEEAVDEGTALKATLGVARAQRCQGQAGADVDLDRTISLLQEVVDDAGSGEAMAEFVAAAHAELALAKAPDVGSSDDAEARLEVSLEESETAAERSNRTSNKAIYLWQAAFYLNQLGRCDRAGEVMGEAAELDDRFENVGAGSIVAQASGKVVPSQEGAPRVVLDGPGLAYTC